jgi:hypothetical protein
MSEQTGPRPGEVWAYVDRWRFGRPVFVESAPPLRIVGPGKREGDWIGTELDGDERKWRITWEQLRDGRYLRRPDLEAGDRVEA